MAAAAAAGIEGDSTAAVGACDSELTGAPHDGQNLLVADISPLQDGQFIMPLPLRFWIRSIEKSRSEQYS